jgi:hypothetical protein
MKTEKKGPTLVAPLVVIAIGLFFILTKRGSYGGLASPEVEGPLVVFIGALFCLLGIWGVVRTFQDRKKKEPNQPLQRNASTGSVSNFKSPARRG